MGHSYSQNLIHCVYSTDERRNLIAPELQEQLWAFKGVIAKREGVPLLVAGGMENHAHLLIALPPTIALAKALQAIKAYSSRWMSEHRVAFKWQEGYVAFSVSPSQVETVAPRWRSGSGACPRRCRKCFRRYRPRGLALAPKCGGRQ